MDSEKCQSRTHWRRGKRRSRFASNHCLSSAGVSPVLVAVGLIFTCAASSTAAPPTLEWFFPPGGPRGEAFEVTAGGDPGDWPVSIWCDASGLQLTPLEEKGKFRVESTADALPGVYWVRMTNKEGASSLRPLILGELPEVLEVEPNDGPTSQAEQPVTEGQADVRWGQTVDVPATINGRFDKAGDVDAFSVALEAGQTLVARLQAHNTLGSPVDAVLQVCQPVQQSISSVAGLPPRVDAYVLEQAHDARGLDPQLELRAERAGTYVVRVFGFPSDPNSTIGFAGGDPLVYRLTLTTEGIIDHALPMAVTSGDAAAEQVRLFGAGIDPEGIAATALPLPTVSADGESDETLPQRSVWRAFVPGKAGEVDLPVVSTKPLSIVGVPPGKRAAALSTEAAEVELPMLAAGRLSAAGEVGAVRVQAPKGDALRIAVESREIGFPLDPVVIVRDAEGKLLERKDGGRNRGDVAFDFTPPADGAYGIEVHDLHGRGGLRFVYRLRIEPVVADFVLALKQDSAVIKPGETAEISVAVERQDGFQEPITVRCVGLPEGIEAEPVVSEGEGDTAKEVTLVLRAAEDREPGYGGPLWVEGTADGESATRQLAEFPLNLPFAGNHTAAYLTVAE